MAQDRPVKLIVMDVDGTLVDDQKQLPDVNRRALQAAVDAPAALKAVVANCATINRFQDDIHWMGGCVLTDTLEWAATLPAILAAPPDAATVARRDGRP